MRAPKLFWSHCCFLACQLNALLRRSVTPHDGARWEDAERFDRVLVDAPCSSDRHVLQQAAARGSGVVSRADWSLQRCRRIAAQQVKLLAAAARVGGWWGLGGVRLGQSWVWRPL